jgi:thymidine phosphorylase
VGEALDCLRGAGPADLREVTVTLAVEMLRVAGDTSSWDALKRRVEGVLDGGAPLERFARVVALQGGDAGVTMDPRRLPSAPVVRFVAAPRSGVVHRVIPEVVGYGVIDLGGGRRRMDDAVDPRVGFEIHVSPGDVVQSGAVLGVVHAATEAGAEAGERVLQNACILGDGPPPPGLPLVGERVEGGDRP